MSALRKKWTVVALCVAVVPAALVMRARGSDHADTPAIAAQPGTDLTDVFVFPSPSNPNNVVLAMNVHPLIPSGMGTTTVFDPDVLYQFKIDNNGDNVEDLVIQATFKGNDPSKQLVSIRGPFKPSRTGTTTQIGSGSASSSVINSIFTTDDGIKVFCGGREDPFFFDLERFLQILPDRATPITGVAVDPAQANVPQATTWRAPGAAHDFLHNSNVLSIVVEMPKSKLIGSGDGKIHVWCTTSR